MNKVRERKVSMKKKGGELAEVANQLQILDDSRAFIPDFGTKLEEAGIDLRPTGIDVMQINLGYMCNQTCEHCHVDAGPDRQEIMTREILEHCLRSIDLAGVKTVDLTGGAPEMSPQFTWFVEELSKRDVQVIVRSNLTILVSNPKYAGYPEFFAKHKVQVIASLPCYTAENTDKQRGAGVFNDSLKALRLLNEVGYGRSETGLELNLVFNPGGPSLPGPQDQLEQDYKRELSTNFGITFNKLYTITNLPISRFLDYLLVIGRYEEYMQRIAEAFNPMAAEGVMCRNTLSVDWQGDLYDCDFNQMLGMKIEGQGHISDFDARTIQERRIKVDQHCYGCTAGAGSSCQGAIT